MRASLYRQADHLTENVFVYRRRRLHRRQGERLTRVSKRAVNSKPAVVCSASNKSDDVAVGSSQDAVTRRQALAAGAAVTATLGASTPRSLVSSTAPSTAPSPSAAAT